MIREIMKNELFLSAPSEPATIADLDVAQDLRDTLAVHTHECVGMAANMIGIRKQVIIFDDNGKHRIMFNPKIEKGYGEYQTEEGCLSLVGKRPCKRFKRIRVAYLDEAFKPKKETFTGWTAEIIQHEIDHCNGIII